MTVVWDNTNFNLQNSTSLFYSKFYSTFAFNYHVTHLHVTLINVYTENANSLYFYNPIPPVWTIMLIKIISSFLFQILKKYNHAFVRITDFSIKWNVAHCNNNVIYVLHCYRNEVHKMQHLSCVHWPFSLNSS